MTVFISYARKDRELVDVLARDIARAKQQVWLDHDLTGGQDWWDTILAQIRECRLFIFVLTPDSIRSRACLAELRYASDLSRPIVPVMVRDVAVQQAPHVIGRAHIVDYRQRSTEAAVDLMNALVSAPDPGALPAPLPEPPTLPASYASSLREQIGADSLTLREQGSVLIELKAHLGDAEERGVVLDLLRDLRRRSDITEVVARDLDTLLAEQAGAPEGAPSETGEGGSADDAVEQVARTHVEDAGSNDIAEGIKPSRRRQRGALSLVVVGAVAAVAVAAIVALTPRGGNDDSSDVDVESAGVTFDSIIEEATFDEAGIASFDECPLGDMSELARTANDAVALSDATLEGDTFFEARRAPDEIYCGVEASDHDSTEGIWAFTVYALGDAASEYESLVGGGEERGDYLNGRIVQQLGEADNGELLCTSLWAPFDGGLGVRVGLYGDGCTLEGSSLALEAVLPGIVESLA